MGAEVFDFIVVGAGIAGASVAAELAADARVLVLEMERQPGYHTTGRSAAIYAPVYGPAPIRALTRASRGFYESPPEGFCEGPLLSQRDTVFIARADQADSLAEMRAELGDTPGVGVLTAGELEQRIPLLRKGYAQAGLRDSGSSEIDVAALHQGYLRQFRARGGVLETRAEVSALTQDKGLWTVTTAADTYRGRVVINAAGAWADQIAELAGAKTVGLKPLRRTAMMVEVPPGTDLAAFPLAVDMDEQFYAKPDAGKLLISPANEDLEQPCDVQPDELDIAICVDRIERALDLSVRRIDNQWAGLRSFVADKCPVVGFAPEQPGFFWLAGQGGYGIQSAPALSRFAAALALGHPVPQYILDEGLTPLDLAPDRAELAV